MNATLLSLLLLTSIPFQVCADSGRTGAGGQSYAVVNRIIVEGNIRTNEAIILREIDFHWSDIDEPHIYWESMDLVDSVAHRALEDAFNDPNVEFVLFRHGSSTSFAGRTTSRSQVRKLMRSPKATPFIVRKHCIQHESVFVAAIKPRK